MCGCGTGHSPIRNWIILTGRRENHRITVKMGVRRWTGAASGLKVTVQSKGALFARVSGHMLGFWSLKAEIEFLCFNTEPQAPAARVCTHLSPGPNRGEMLRLTAGIFCLIWSVYTQQRRIRPLSELWPRKARGSAFSRTPGSGLMVVSPRSATGNHSSRTTGRARSAWPPCSKTKGSGMT